jgi:inner membrane protein
MDTLTHIALGACIGEVLAGKQLGKKALFLGAFANTIPDFDFLSSFWLTTDENLLAHRGFTHSFLFAILVSVLLGFLFNQWMRKYQLPLKKWILFFLVQIFTHLFIDSFNAYGTGWFEPFSHVRISFNTIFVADPFYSVWPGIAALLLFILKKNHPRRTWWSEFGIGISSIYLLYCIVNKVKLDLDMKEMLQRQHVPVTQMFTTPTPLNNWLWYVVAGDEKGFYTGYYSVFDNRKQIDLHYVKKNDSLLIPVKNKEALTHLIRFSKGFYTAETWSDTLVFNDLRFGQMAGWDNAANKFVFHYFLRDSTNNKLVVQRGRFANWNLSTATSLIKRIKGK